MLQNKNKTTEATNQSPEVRDISKLSARSKAILLLSLVTSFTSGGFFIYLAKFSDGNISNKTLIERCYVVKEGDTLTNIGQRMSPAYSWQDLYAINGSRLSSPDLLKNGDTVALVPRACEKGDQEKQGYLVNNSEKGVTSADNYPYELAVTRPGDTLALLAKRLNVLPESITKLNSTLQIEQGGIILPNSLIIIPATQKARLESAFLRPEKDFTKGSWQIAATVEEIRGSKDFGTEAIKEIYSNIKDKEVNAVKIDEASGKLSLFPGKVIAIYEDSNHKGRFIAEVQNEFGDQVLVGLDSLLVKLQ